MILSPWLDFAQRCDYRHRFALRNSQGEAISWQELAQQIENIASELAEQGVHAGVGVALWGKNTQTLLLTYLGALHLGARVMVVNPAFTLEKAKSVFIQNQMAFVYLEKDLAYMGKVLAKIGAFKLLEDLDTTGSSKICDKAFSQGLTMTLTSGSTALPKAVVHRVTAHLDNAVGVCELISFTSADAYLLSLPLYHVSGQGILWRWLSQGGELHLPQSDFYASVCLASHCSFVPTQALRFLAYLEAHPDLPCKTAHILLGGSNIPVSLTQALEKQGIQSYCGYGMTEMASTIFAKKANESIGVGQILPNRAYRLIDGEIYVKGAGLALGYWLDNQLIPLTDEQGFFATKDTGVWSNGELVITGRRDNQFISGGENIQPEEIERIIETHPQVQQAVVLPLVDPEFGQRPVAMVAFYPSFSKDLVADLKVFLLDKLEKFKHPIAYYPLDNIQAQSGIKLSRSALQIKLQQLIELSQ